jgi:catechol-2,3-dioxygenase
MLIDRVTLSSRNLEAQRVFYGEVLGLPTQMDESGALHVQIGRSELVFRQLQYVGIRVMQSGYMVH